MASYTGFTDNGRKNVAKDAFRRASACVGLAEIGMSNWDDRTKKIFRKWFGVANEEEKAVVSRKVYQMNFYVNNLPITINDAGATLGANTNAMASYVGSIGSSSYAKRQVDSNISGVKIDFTDRFFNTLRSIQSDDQTQIETVVHELSHLAAGTDDKPDGACYGRVNALALATGQPLLAQNNAENYGFFVIEIGGETPVYSAKGAMGSGRKWAVVKAPALVR